MNCCEVTYIYGLYEIENEDIRYIGKTDNIKKRLHDHKYDTRKNYKASWIKSVLDKGGTIGAKVIAVVDKTIWKEKEKYYISEYRKTNKLVNLTDGGDGTLSNIYNKPLIECKRWLLENKPIWVKSIKTYKKWSLMEDFPNFLPKAPHKVFSDWVSWGDYLLTDNIRTVDRKKFYLSFNEAKEFLKEYNFNNSKEFSRKSFPYFIPKKPDIAYKDEWKGWSDFLSYKPHFRKDNVYLDFESARNWIKENYGNITTSDYRKFSKEDLLPDFLPKKPEKIYPNFKWGEYLFSNGKSKSKDFYLDFDEARKISRSLGLKNNKEWRSWKSSRSTEYVRIPGSPDYTYKDKWVNWKDWLGY